MRGEQGMRTAGKGRKIGVALRRVAGGLLIGALALSVAAEVGLGAEATLGLVAGLAVGVQCWSLALIRRRMRALVAQRERLLEEHEERVRRLTAELNRESAGGPGVGPELTAPNSRQDRPVEILSFSDWPSRLDRCRTRSPDPPVFERFGYSDQVSGIRTSQ